MPEKTIFEEIITELLEISKKLDQSELKDILKKYKKGKEENLRDGLLEWNTNFNSLEDDFDDLDEETGKRSKKKKELKIQPVYWLKIGNYKFPTWQIYSLEKSNQYDFTLGEFEYKILVNNGIETKNTLIRDVEISFSTEEDRDKEYEELEKRLEKFNIKFV